MTGGDSPLPPTGSIEVVKPRKAAKLVEGIAADAEDPAVRTEPLLIALDVDGTVLLEDETLSPGVVEAIAHAHRAGHEVMLATGRSWEGTRGIQHVLDLAPEYAVCSNGAVIMKRVSGDLGEESVYERFHVETFDPTDVLAHLRDHLPHAGGGGDGGDGHSAGGGGASELSDVVCGDARPRRADGAAGLAAPAGLGPDTVTHVQLRRLGSWAAAGHAPGVG